MEEEFVYIASPLGFAKSSKYYIRRLHELIERTGFKVLDPWDEDYSELLAIASRWESVTSREKALREVNEEIARANLDKIQKCKVLLAVLDGVDVDSGTAGETGYAFALNKKILGLRTDFRLAGDNLGCVVNLQVEYFITHSRAALPIARDLDELERFLRIVKRSI